MLEKIDFTGNLVGVDGVELTEKKSILLSQILANLVEGDAVKIWGWALHLRKEGYLELDKSDTGLLKDIILNSKSMTVLGKAQLLECFE